MRKFRHKSLDYFDARPLPSWGGNVADIIADEGAYVLYRLNGHALKPIHDSVSNYERSRSERFDQLDVVLDDLKQKEEGDGPDE